MRVPVLLGVVAVTAVLSACSSQESRPVAQQGTAVPAPTSTAVPAPRSTASAPSAPRSPVPSPPPRVVRSGDGRLVQVPGGSAGSGGPPGSGQGTSTPYVVEVEGGLGIDATAFAREVDRILADPRSWGAGGRRVLHRVPPGEDVVLRVVLASPDTTDRLCAPLRTNGRFSCATGDRAVLNAARWLTGADSYAGLLPRYREYLVNHEVGHVLGHGHVSCPGPGEPAPVMLQQTKGLDGCARNPWPYP